ncbi:MAG: DinB family protein [Calditrichaeota bacterium]|nr:DinB family protein [Calditrichota bacterium]MCB9369793.1 DinB family protein [Calditrichota bacterium]
MSEVTRLVGLMGLAFDGDEDGDGRFGPALMPQLVNVDAKFALNRPLPDAHCIWELVLHLAAWKRYVAKRLQDEPADITPEMNWESIPQTDEQAWKGALQSLRETHVKVVEVASRLKDEQLATPCAGGTIPRYQVLQDIVQHDVYHGGQIAILKKAKL